MSTETDDERQVDDEVSELAAALRYLVYVMTPDSKGKIGSIAERSESLDRARTALNRYKQRPCPCPAHPASVEQLEHERNMLAQALGECIEAAGITTPGTALTGPQLLMFVSDLKTYISGLRQFERIVGSLRAEVEREQYYRDILHSANAGLDKKVQKLGGELEVAHARVAELERKLRDEENAHITTIEQRADAGK